MARPGDYYERGPTPWVPATILGIILLIATTPYRMAPDPFGYQSSYYRPTSFPSALIWMPVLAVLAVQFFGGGYRPYRNNRLGEPLTRNAPYGGGMFGGYGGGMAGGYGDTMYPNRGRYSNSNYQFNGPYDKGLMSSFMDYGGHWMLILLGIWLFSMVGVGSAPAATAAMSPPRLSSPWSLFAPRQQYVVPMM